MQSQKPQWLYHDPDWVFKPKTGFDCRRRSPLIVLSTILVIFFLICALGVETEEHECHTCLALPLLVPRHSLLTEKR